MTTKPKRMKEQTLTITYTGKKDDEIDSMIAGLLEFPPFNFDWVGQGYNFKTDQRDLSFIRMVKE